MTVSDIQITEKKKAGHIFTQQFSNRILNSWFTVSAWNVQQKMPMQIFVEKPREKRYMSIIKHMRNSKRLIVCFSTWTLEKQGGTCARFQLLKPYRLDATLKLLTR